MKSTISTLKFLTLTLVAGLLFVRPAAAQLEPWEDFDISDAVWDVSLIKVNANMMDQYLEGLRDTWVEANKLAKELGHIEDYAIYSSALPQSGDFNLMLVVKFTNTEALAPSKARYDAFMEKWGETRVERNREISKDYPSMREIAGQYALREITIK